MEIKKFSNMCGKKLKQLRVEKKLTQQKISEITGLSRSFVAHLELGDRQPSLYSIYLLSRAYKLKPSELVKLLIG